MNGKEDFEAIVFDAYGTLFDLDSFASEANRIYRGRGKAISQTMRQKQLEFAMARDIMGKYSDFEMLTRNAIEFALKKSGIKRTDAGRRKTVFKISQSETFQGRNICSE